MKDKKGKHLSPCIASKAKYALGINTNYSGNKKTCSKDYWYRVIDSIVASRKFRLDKMKVLDAKWRHDLYMTKKAYDDFEENIRYRREFLDLPN